MNTDGMIEVIVLIFVIIGTLMSLLSSFGLIRLPDVYTRSHAATKTTTIGLLNILFAAFLYFWLKDGFVSYRLLLGIVFVFITAPVAGHLIARSAHRSGVKMADMSIKDELADDLATMAAKGELSPQEMADLPRRPKFSSKETRTLEELAEDGASSKSSPAEG